MSMLKTSLKIVSLLALMLACSIGIWLLWWHAPVSVRASYIVKTIDSDIHSDRVDFCNAFSMTPDEFRAYWKDVRPIFDVELHDYSFGSCHFETTENNTTYKIGIGGVGIVSNEKTVYYYVRTSDKPDLAGDMPPDNKEIPLSQKIKETWYLIEYILRHGFT